jgi:hypothetical protein
MNYYGRIAIQYQSGIISGRQKGDYGHGKANAGSIYFEYGGNETHLRLNNAFIVKRIS